MTRSTALLFRSLACGIAGLCVLWGCQGGDASARSNTTSTTPAKTVGPPTTPFEATPIALVGNGAVRIGDAPEKARRVYPEPPRGAYDLHDLPERFPKPYAAQGWESSRGEGFGLITWSGDVVAAMYQIERGDEDRLGEILNQQRAGTGDLYPNDILGKTVRFWFWERRSQRLMVCAYRRPNKVVSITVAMGDVTVLDALDASPESAKRIQARLDNGEVPQLIQETYGKATNGEPLPATSR